MTLSFSVDNELNISSWDKNMEEFTGKRPDEVIGKKYYDVLPRLYTDGSDTIVSALENKNSLHIKNYNYKCLFGSTEADVKINYLNGTGGTSKIEVTIDSVSCCAYREEYHRTKGLIDIGKIASSLAHGIRNPLNALKGAVVYLEEKYKDENILTDFTKIMSEEIDRLDSFISKFLSTSMAGLDTSDVDINALIKKIEILVSLQTKAQNIKTEFKYGTLPRIKVNSYQIEQAILNVINNAIDAMKSNGDLKVRTYTRSMNETPHAVISISDSGPGMLDCEGEYPTTGRDHSSGKGYGLIIVHEILRSCNGTMRINSKKDVGTTIELYLPY